MTDEAVFVDQLTPVASRYLATLPQDQITFSSTFLMKYPLLAGQVAECHAHYVVCANEFAERQANSLEDELDALVITIRAKVAELDSIKHEMFEARRRIAHCDGQARNASAELEQFTFKQKQNANALMTRAERTEAEQKSVNLGLKAEAAMLEESQATTEYNMILNNRHNPLAIEIASLKERAQELQGKVARLQGAKENSRTDRTYGLASR